MNEEPALAQRNLVMRRCNIPTCASDQQQQLATGNWQQPKDVRSDIRLLFGLHHAAAAALIHEILQFGSGPGSSGSPSFTSRFVAFAGSPRQGTPGSPGLPPHHRSVTTKFVLIVRQHPKHPVRVSTHCRRRPKWIHLMRSSRGRPPDVSIDGMGMPACPTVPVHITPPIVGGHRLVGVDSYFSDETRRQPWGSQPTVAAVPGSEPAFWGVFRVMIFAGVICWSNPGIRG